MKHGQVSIYVVASNSHSPLSLLKAIKGSVSCIKNTPEFRINDSPFTLFWWDLQVKNITALRNEIQCFQHNNPHMSAFIMDHSIPRTYVDCN